MNEAYSLPEESTEKTPDPFETAAAAAEKRGSPDVARRIRTEGRVVRRLVADILAAGHTISVHDGEEMVLERGDTADSVLAAMFSTDEDFLYVDHAPEGLLGRVELIYGNDGWDVVHDYSSSLEPLMAGASEESRAAEAGR